MGYYVTLDDANFLIKPENLDEALVRLKALNAPTNDNLKRGGSYGGGGKTESWFSWMPPDYDKTVTSAKEVFDLLGFETSLTDEGLRLLGYDSKTGQEDVFLNVVADLVEPGSYLTWTGEDGDKWRYFFNGATMEYQAGTVSYG